MKGVLVKRGGSLFPEGYEAVKMFNRMEEGERCKGEHVKNKNYKNLNKFFELANQSFKYQHAFQDLEEWRKELIILGGHYEEVIKPAPEWLEWICCHLEENLGSKHKEKIITQLQDQYTIQKRAKSISLENMTDEDFRKLIKKAITGFSEHYAAGMSEQDFMKILRFDF